MADSTTPAKKAPAKKAAVKKAVATLVVESGEEPVKAKYIALKPMSLADGSTVSIGDPVPEAVNWLRVESWVRAGYIREIDS